MTLALGTRHVVTGAGQFAIANPVGLVVATAGIPNYVARASGTPIVYYRLGHLNLGTALGWQPNLDLVLSPQLVYPLAPEFDLLRYNLLNGETCTIDEIASASSSTALMQPWDRHPVPQVNGYDWIAVGGQSDTTLWTFVVPAGRIFRVTLATVWQMRTIAATSLAYPRNYITIGSSVFLEQYCFSNVPGSINTVSMQGGPLDLPAGTSLRGAYYDNDAGGQIQFGNLMSGYLFDA